MVSPGSSGYPPVITRSGSPAVWASMAVIFIHPSGGCQLVSFIMFPPDYFHSQSFIGLCENFTSLLDFGDIFI
jgi:hypothetical protein